jgi:hypothetical protein
MKQALALVAALGLTTGVAFAQTVEDTDGDGVYSFAELQAAFPDLTDDVFVLIDTNGDGSVDPEELEAAIATGLIGG